VVNQTYLDMANEGEIPDIGIVINASRFRSRIAALKRGRFDEVTNGAESWVRIFGTATSLPAGCTTVGFASRST
jgi:hypothetical protein